MVGINLNKEPKNIKEYISFEMLSSRSAYMTQFWPGDWKTALNTNDSWGIVTAAAVAMMNNTIPNNKSEFGYSVFNGSFDKEGRLNTSHFIEALTGWEENRSCTINWNRIWFVET